MINIQTLLDGLFLVVVALYQMASPADIVLAFDLWRVELDVVGAAGSQVRTTTCHAAQ
jgi:hypothetical protein